VSATSPERDQQKREFGNPMARYLFKSEQFANGVIQTTTQQVWPLFLPPRVTVQRIGPRLSNARRSVQGRVESV
jgi:hypothetical protein